MGITDTDREVVRGIVERRGPQLLADVDDLGRRPLAAAARDRLRLLLVDEACDVRGTGLDAARRILALEELLARL